MATPSFLREFEFLPDLPKSNLDDRTFNDLVQECKLRIPRYCQEWTNHNPSDPGITLIELFAWLTDQMLLRFNQVPRLHYVAFLELLGIRLQPPTAAQTDLTFYLTKAVSLTEEEVQWVGKGTEVATVRTETEPAVVFTTCEDLVIGRPRLMGLFTAHKAESGSLDTRELDSPRGISSIDWQALRSVRLFETSEVGNCFYLVLTPDQDELVGPGMGHSLGSAGINGNGHRSNGDGDGQNGHETPGVVNSITGNVIALNFKGVVAGSTGIDPTDPPIRWEVWTGETWEEGILLHQGDDKTKGFSFHELQEQGANLDQTGADVILHLPQQWPEEDFGSGCSGHWIRCVYHQQRDTQYRYSRSPLIDAITVRSIGGTVTASECVTIKNELVGISNGKPGQSFQLEGFPILERDSDTEYLFVKPPDEAIARPILSAQGFDSLEIHNGIEGERWHEVEDFSDSVLDEVEEETNAKRHYTLDARTGTLQFGPLVREPSQLQYQTLERTRLQPWGKDIQGFSTRMALNSELIASDDSDQLQQREWQYGKVPPRGSEIYMSAYRVGGGSQGNVKAHTLTILKTAIPYVKSVINHQDARGGKDAESLDEAVLRVPQVLRTAKSAMIPEDFETVSRNAHTDIYRTHCLPCTTPGVVRLLAVAYSGQRSPSNNGANFVLEHPQGLHPDEYRLSKKVHDRLLQELDERKPVGVQIRLEPAHYVGVSVEAEVLVEPQYRSPELQRTIAARIRAHLYRYLNPLTGGLEGKGWELGRSLSPSDVIAQLQSISEIQYVGRVELFALRHHPYDGWFRTERPEVVIDPGPLGLLCSWHKDDEDLNSDHQITFMQ